MNIIFHNGAFKQADIPVLSAYDRALRGEGVFDTMLIRDGKAQHAGLHFNRLIRHANVLDIMPSLSAAQLQDKALELIKKNTLTEDMCALNTTITGGPGARGLSKPADPETQIIMRVSALPKTSQPIHAIIAGSTRRNEGSLLSQIKSLNYGDNILALQEAKKAGANEAILLNNQDRVTCATIGNVFVLKNGKLYTPPKQDGVMNGIARSLLLQNHGAEEKSLSVRDLDEADGIFIANSVRGLSPIETLNNKELQSIKSPVPVNFHHE